MGPCLQAAVQDQDLQAAARGGRGARQARCPSLIRGNGPNKKAQLNLEKNLNKLLDEAMLEATKVASQRTPEHLILIIVPHPLQLPSGCAPWFISMSAGT